MSSSRTTSSDLASLLAPLNIAPTIVALGVGNMGGTIVRAWHSNRLTDVINIGVTAKTQKTIDSFKDLPFTSSTSNASMLHSLPGGMCMFGFKPYMFADVVADCGAQLLQQRMIISVMAGVTIRQMTDALLALDGATLATLPIIVRIMPNTPSLISRGANVYALPPQCAHDADVAAVIEALFTPLGLILRVDENKINAVSGVAGCGPAYIYTVIDALSDGGVKMGLPRALSIQLAAQMVAGAAEMVLQTGKHPGELKNAVCSPGGATICGVTELERANVRAAFINAVEAATVRSDDMSK